MMRFSIAIIALSSILLNSCTSKSNQETEVETDKEKITDTALKTIPPRITINTDLDKDVKRLSEENTSFHDLLIQLEKINTTSVKNFSNETEAIQENCNEFVKTLPDAFQTKSVYSRIDAIKTFANAIAFEKKKGFNDTTKLHNYSNNLVLSYNSLIFQLNDSRNKLPDVVKKSLQETVKIKKDSIIGEPLF